MFISSAISSNMTSLGLSSIRGATRQTAQAARSRVGTIRCQARYNHGRPIPPPKVPSSSRVQRYLPRLQDLANRTGVPLSSLAVSFLILHELTAVLPVVGFYFIFSSLGTGLGIIEWLNRTTDGEEDTGWRGVVHGWYDEGQKKIGRVGKRYGLWQGDEQVSGGARAGEGVANAVAAYVVVKALLPVRIGVSLGASPVFARWALEPIRNLGKRWIGRKKTPVP